MEHKPAWFIEHEVEDKDLFDARPTKEEMRTIVREELTTFFSNKGKEYKNYIIATAILMGSVTVILGGFKAILGWLGFTMMK